MKKDDSTDLIILTKIIRYISELNRIIEKFEISSYHDFENEYIALSSATQTITNIYELKKILQDSTIDKIPQFNNIKIEATRNIASHQYDSIKPNIVYIVIKKLVDAVIINELEAVINEIAEAGIE